MDLTDPNSQYVDANGYVSYLTRLGIAKFHINTPPDTGIGWAGTGWYGAEHFKVDAFHARMRFADGSEIIRRDK